MQHWQRETGEELGELRWPHYQKASFMELHFLHHIFVEQEQNRLHRFVILHFSEVQSTRQINGCELDSQWRRLWIRYEISCRITYPAVWLNSRYYCLELQTIRNSNWRFCFFGTLIAESLIVVSNIILSFILFFKNNWKVSKMKTLHELHQIKNNFQQINSKFFKKILIG